MTDSDETIKHKILDALKTSLSSNPFVDAQWAFKRDSQDRERMHLTIRLIGNKPYEILVEQFEENDNDRTQN